MKQHKGDNRTARILVSSRGFSAALRCHFAQAMDRDGHRCMITSLEDYNRPNGEIIVQAAHIIPQSVNKNIEEGTANVCAHIVFLSSANVVVQHRQSGGVRAILTMFTNESIIKELVGDRINRLENILSLNSASHHFFGELRLWLKPVEVRSPSLLSSCVIIPVIRMDHHTRIACVLLRTLLDAFHPFRNR